MKRILVADDDPTIISLLGNILENRSYEVLRARDGQQAWQLALKELPDIAILDREMPILNGQEVCRRLRADPRTRHMGIIFLTGSSEESEKVAGFEAGADDYVVKPFQPREVAARVAALLKRTEVVRVAGVSAGTPGKVLALLGGKGGVGTSTLAVNLAVAMTEGGSKVCLVDLDLEHSIDGMLLDVIPGRRGTIADLSRDFESGINWDLFKEHLVVHKSGLSLLPGPIKPAEAEYVRGGHVKTYVELLRRNFDFVVADLHSDFRDITLDMVEVADQFILVVSPDLLALKAYRALREVLRELSVPDSMLRVVVNQPFSTIGLNMDVVHRALELPNPMAVPFGGAGAMDSVNRGVPMVQARPKSEMSLAVKNLAKSLAQVSSDA